MNTCKIVYHTIRDSKPVKNIQQFRSLETANQWSEIQKERGFSPVSVEENISVDAGMVHIGDVSKVHEGHYIEHSWRI